jgi:ERCC4-type nuclease
MDIILDTREHGLIKLMPDVPTQLLPVGDIWIGPVVAERKTIADLESSLRDGRYREQRTRLLAHCAETKGRPLYIIEGSFNTCRTSVNIVFKVLARLTLRYGISIIQTDSLADTVMRIKDIAELLAKDKDCFNAEMLSYTDVVTHKKANKEDPTNFLHAVLQQCPGVSAEKAKSIAAQFKNLEGVMAANEKELTECTTNGRKMGPVVAKRLWNLLHFVPV